MKEVMAITKALADDNRARIVTFLGDGELCVCQIMEVLGLAPATVSAHLNILHRAGLLESRKEGRWVYYRLPGRNAPPHVKNILRWLEDATADDPQILQDAAKLKTIRKLSKGDLCQRHKS